jgi:alpha-D-xyloside xylohydrolase
LARESSQAHGDVDLESSEARLLLSSASVRVEVELAPFRIAFKAPDGCTLLRQDYADTDVIGRLASLPFGFSIVGGRRAAFHDSFTAEPDEHFFGFGEKFTDFDKRGQRLEMWNRDALGVDSELAYKNVPFFVSSRGYGVFVDSLTCVNFDMASSRNGVFGFVVPDTVLDYYFIAGPDPKDIVSRYATLVGRPIIPPKWALGFWISSGFLPDSQAAVLARARMIREQAIPCDVLHLDCYWQPEGTWSGMGWDASRFPDPEAMIRTVKQLGFKVSLWINPYLMVGSGRFEEARSRGYLLRCSTGEPFVGDLWGGKREPVGIVDMTNPDAVRWFQGLLRPLLRMGVDVFKTDFGEGVPADTVAWNGMAGAQLHNLYPLLYNDVVAEVTREETGGTGLVWARSSYAGGQRHAAQWGGDPKANYSSLAATLRGGLSLGLCGHAFWSHDIGGYKGQPSSELYVRWAQFGLLSPLSRAHGASSRLPWDFGEEALRIVREYARMRYRLMPYLYTYARLAAETGLPILRPLLMEFPGDPSAYSVDLQYMFGAELMVAPVYNDAGSRAVYFPPGKWVDYWSREMIAGPQTRRVISPLDKIPIYVRLDALIPTTEPHDHLEETPFEDVIFEGYVEERATFELRDVDGNTAMTVAREEDRLAIWVEGARRDVSLLLMPLTCTQPPQRVLANGKQVKLASETKHLGGGSSTWSVLADGTLHVDLRGE